MRFLPLTLFACILHGTSLTQTFIDPQLGSDSATGTAQDPLRTVTHALATGAADLRLRPGTYSEASGEVFPWTTQQFPVELRGTDPIDLPRIVVSTDDVAIISLTPAAVVDRLTLRDLEFEGNGTDSWAELLRPGTIRIERCRARNFRFGAGNPNFHFGQSRVLIEDSTVEDVAGEVVAVQGQASAVNLGSARIVRSTLRDCHTPVLIAGVYFDYPSSEIEDSLMVRCGPSRLAKIRRSTIVDATSYGTEEGRIEDCIVVGSHLGDLGPGTSALQCFIGDGSGPLSGDPRFVDPGAGDYRLRADSPCVDVALVSHQTDLLGRMRSVDGDLDLVPARDLGALELQLLDRPLGAQKTLPLGQPYDLEVRGPRSAWYQLLFSRMGTAPASTTPFGSLLLDNPTRIGLHQLSNSGDHTVSVPMAPNPALIGSELGFQVLLRSPQAPAGGALSNGLELTVAAQ